MFSLRLILRTLSVVCLIVIGTPSISHATLLNATVVSDTPTAWSGYIDWTQPTSASSQTLDVGPNWSISAVEVPTGGGLGVLVITARHLVEPHGPPNPAG